MDTRKLNEKRTFSPLLMLLGQLDLTHATSAQGLAKGVCSRPKRCLSLEARRRGESTGLCFSIASSSPPRVVVRAQREWD